MDSKVSIKLVRLSDNAEFLIDNTVWAIPSDGLAGFGDSEVTVNEDSLLYHDGTVLMSTKMEAKDRTVKCYAIDVSTNENLRDMALKFFHIKEEYKLIIKYMGHERWCKGIITHAKLSEGNIYRRVELMFNLHCFSPYFYGMQEFGQDISGLTPMNAFPYHSVAEWGGHPCGIVAGNSPIVINNAGDIDIGPHFIIEFTSDYNQYISIFITNDSLIDYHHGFDYGDKFNRGDVLDLDFSVVPPKITKNGKNDMKHSLSFNNTLLGVKFKRGENSIDFSPEGAQSVARVTLYYNECYYMI
jgi:hypothetical protein